MGEIVRGRARDTSVGEVTERAADEAVNKTAEIAAAAATDKGAGKITNRNTDGAANKVPNSVANALANTTTEIATDEISNDSVGRAAAGGWVLSDAAFFIRQADSGRTVKADHIHLKPGTVTLIVGSNGAGKTTLLEGLAGLRELAYGSVTLDGEALWKGKKINRQVIMQLMIALQHSESQWFARTVGEELRYSLRPFALAAPIVQERIMQALEQTGLESGDLLERDPWSLSGGQQRRLALACVLAAETPWLLLDEPTAGLDASGIRMLRAVLADHKAAGRGAVIVTHDSEALAELADQVLLVGDGVARLLPPASEQPADGTGGSAGPWASGQQRAVSGPARLPEALALAAGLRECGFELPHSHGPLAPEALAAALAQQLASRSLNGAAAGGAAAADEHAAARKAAGARGETGTREEAAAALQRSGGEAAQAGGSAAVEHGGKARRQAGAAGTGREGHSAGPPVQSAGAAAEALERAAPEASALAEAPERAEPEASTLAEAPERAAPEASAPAEAPDRAEPEASAPAEAPERAELEASALAEAPERAALEAPAPAAAPERAAPEASALAEAPERAAPKASAPAEAPDRAAPEASALAEAPERAAPEASSPAEAPERAVPKASAPAEAPERAVPEASAPAEAPDHGAHPWSRRDPRALWAAYLLLAAGVLMQQQWWGAALGGVVTASLLNGLWASLRPWFGAIRMYAGVMAVFLCFSSLSFAPLSFDPGHFINTALHLFKLLLVMLLGLALPTLITPLRLRRALEQGLAFLKPLKVPVAGMALTAALIFRFIPLLVGEWERFALIAHARGKAVSPAGKVPLGKLHQVLLPFMVAMLRLADQMSAAMEARGFGVAGRRTTYAYRLRFTRSDAMLVVSAGGVFLGLLGFAALLK
ncbi:ATP-binding cassette domain-containing protein [Paenibacillaceae bacterium]|nr:ATP-binding cassette domain-containing protein [Paenibacillaceae bacterium]